MVYKSYHSKGKNMIQYTNSDILLFNPSGKSQVFFHYVNSDSVKYAFNFNVFRLDKTNKFYNFVKDFYKW